MKIGKSVLGLFLISLIASQAFATDLIKTQWVCQNLNPRLIGGYRYTVVCLTSTGWVGTPEHTRNQCDVSRKVTGPSPSETKPCVPVVAATACKVEDWDLTVHFDDTTHTSHTASIQVGEVSIASCKVSPEAEVVLNESGQE